MTAQKSTQLFRDKVLAVVKKIPKGKTMNYKEVATRAGSPGASRAVGSIMKANYNLEVPCHRVIRTDGKIGEYNRGGPSAKHALLVSEGALKK
jgi:O-6-methylguanine DNA methyltransferase